MFTGNTAQGGALSPTRTPISQLRPVHHRLHSTSHAAPFVPGYWNGLQVGSGFIDAVFGDL
ncbi:hypothetical protein J1614_004342 [Plenodomus biglobosus]|nr:hypothetical protein J1614_004342 [Plenodomus biglobosus]